MYSIDWNEFRATLIRLRKAKKAIEKEYVDLCNICNYASKKYHADNDPVMADCEYDYLFKKLRYIEEIYINGKDNMEI